MTMTKKLRRNIDESIIQFDKEIDLVDFNKVKNRMLIAVRIDELREKLGWNHTELAEKLKKKQSVITKWLSGTHNFTSDTLTEISSAFGMSLGEFINPSKSEVINVNVFSVSAESIVKVDNQYTRSEEFASLLKNSVTTSPIYN
jgi:transcriptional regulator with XRE-family HTH domain